MDDVSERLQHVLEDLEEVADANPPDEAVSALDNATLQLFWRRWPELSSWAGAVWRRLDAELSMPSTSIRDHDTDEIGGSG